MTNLQEEQILRAALQLGFSGAAFTDVSALTIVPDYRRYCEMNLCHCYNVNPSCPPQCGTVEELSARVRTFSRVLVLQTLHDSDFSNDPEGAKAAKAAHNRLADRLTDRIRADYSGRLLRMSAGPWKEISCMSAYCVDAQKLADAVGMVCWAQDGKCRFFSQILFE